ncbi:MAG: hypothetical protein GVY19_03520, partial [Bacteroidetes bacterium]|nr:hypothetical protein [Bacteroidota bacterium]
MKKFCLYIIFLLFIGIKPSLYAQCSLITDNFSGQYPSSVCAPVTLDMEVRYKFFVPVDPAKVEILYVWNDDFGTTTQVPAISQGDTVFTQVQSHLYPPSNQCAYTAEAFVVYDGEVCTSSSRQQQTFSAWARDNENGADLTTDPVVAPVCEGENIVDVTFDDNTTFNCNMAVEPDKPNRITRWVQFIYGTQTIGGDRIPDVTVDDGAGTVHQLTDATGNSLGTVSGPIVEIPTPADAPNQTTWEISAPAGAEVGDVFEITLRNWNICNPYDETPFDGNPPTDIVNGDNPPITTTARIEIVDAPDQIPDPDPAFCTGDNITLTVASGGGDLYWYSDAGLSNLVHTGNNFDPTNPPVNLDNNVAQTATFYVVEENALCSGPSGEVNMEIIDQPTIAAAGPDTTICADNFTLQGNTVTIGQGTWTTTGGATINNINDPNTGISNLDMGPNTFRWTSANGICTSFDEVVITRDVQPSSAQLGNDSSLCNTTSLTLNGNVADNGGTGAWSVLTGSGILSDPNDPNATLTNVSYNSNRLVWEITSQYGACPVTTDTIEYTVDIGSAAMDASPDTVLCQTTSLSISGTSPLATEASVWTSVGTSAIIEHPDSATTTVLNLEAGINRFAYKLESFLGICPVLNDTLTIERFIMTSPADAGADIAVCDSHSVDLNANTPAIGTGSWHIIDKPSGSTPQITPDSLSASSQLINQPGDEGRYTLVWRIENGICVSEDTVIADFGIPPPQASAAPDTVVCGNTMHIMGNSGKGLFGHWDVVSGPTPVNFVSGDTASNTMITIPEYSSGQYVLTWTLSSGSCTPQSDSITLTFKPYPLPPITENDSSCTAGPITLKAALPANANTLNWYTEPMSGSPIGNFDSIHFTNLTQDTAFRVTTYNDTTGCESPGRLVTGKIFNIPDPPLYSNPQYCGPDTFYVPVQPGMHGNTIRWYEPASSTPFFERDTLMYTTSISDTFLISSYNSETGCEGEKDTLRITIYNTPETPIAPDVTQCDSGTVNLSASPGAYTTDLFW